MNEEYIMNEDQRLYIFVCQSSQTGCTPSRLVDSDVELVLWAFTLLTIAVES